MEGDAQLVESKISGSVKRCHARIITSLHNSAFPMAERMPRFLRLRLVVKEPDLTISRYCPLGFGSRNKYGGLGFTNIGWPCLPWQSKHKGCRKLCI